MSSFESFHPCFYRDIPAVPSSPSGLTLSLAELCVAIGAQPSILL
jgi:hypothetical protein